MECTSKLINKGLPEVKESSNGQSSGGTQPIVRCGQRCLERRRYKKCFDETQLKYEIILTKKNEDLGEVIRGRLKEGFDLVVAAGGDGTVSAVINGLMETKIPLSIVPLGTVTC